MAELSIGELAERTGVAPETLRAWERRYGLLEPQRTSGGHRRYDELDVARVMQARRLTEQGLPIAVAARRLTGAPAASQPRSPAASASLERLRRRTWQAVERLDAAGVDATFREARQTVGLAAALDAVAVPLLRRLGDEWRRSPRNIAREHLTSTVLRSHLLQAIRDVEAPGPTCIAACADGEQHDLGVIMAVATMAEIGWRPLVLGGTTPWASIEVVVEEMEPAVLFIGASMRARRPPLPPGWRPPARTLVVLGGPGIASAEIGARPAVLVHQGAYADLPTAVLKRTDPPASGVST